MTARSYSTPGGEVSPYESQEETRPDLILASHAGSLPRPEDLIEANRRRTEVGFADEDGYQRDLAAAVTAIVARQQEGGVDLVNDGEYGHTMGQRYDYGSWWTYVFQRLGGLELAPVGLMEVRRETLQPGEVVLCSFNDRRDWLAFARPTAIPARGPCCPTAPPGACPRSAARRPGHRRELGSDQPGAHGGRLQALHHGPGRGPEPRHPRAAAERIRFHLCWGSWHGPHTTDIPMADIVDVMLAINAGAYSFEAANVRHEREWKVWRDVRLPGVVSHATNVVEHPEVVADRIVRFAEGVGRENVIASTDCGLGGWVHPQIAWAKLGTLASATTTSLPRTTSPGTTTTSTSCSGSAGIRSGMSPGQGSPGQGSPGGGLSASV